MVNPFDIYPVQRRKVERMLNEFNALGVPVDVVRNDGLSTYVKGGKIVSSLQADFVLYFDKEIAMAQLLEKCGIAVFNSAQATAICDDKMLTHATLADCGIVMPDTVCGPLCYNSGAEIDENYIMRTRDTLGLPMVVKERHGSFGEQVYLCETFAELKGKLAELKLKPYLLQRYESSGSGKDMRVIVIGGKAVCAMVRTNTEDFRSNIGLGGMAEATEIPEDIASLCQRAAKIIGLDYCGVDVLLTDEPKLIEVNSNAMFEAMESVTGVNVARLYAEYIVNKVSK